LIDVGLWHQLWHERPIGVVVADLAVVANARIPLARALSNRKRPAGEGEAFLGLLQGGEICISIYVICGR
jgi:hypothetical protein